MITREVIQNIPLYTVIKEMMKNWYHIIHGCQEVTQTCIASHEVIENMIQA